MKKISYLLLVILLIMGVLLFSFIYSQEENELSPIEHYQLKEKIYSTENADIVEAKSGFVHNGLEYEFISFEILEEEETHAQSKYLAEEFYLGELPDLNEMEQICDRDAIKEQCPALKDMWEDTTGKYSMEETSRIYNENLDVIERNTRLVHPDRYYVFVKCKITNSWETSVEEHLNMLDVYISDESKENYSWRTDTMCYFNKSVYLSGDERDHSYFLYTFLPGETLECTLGFEIRNEVENPEFYIGFAEVALQDAGINPVLGRNVVKLSQNVK